MLKKLLGTTGVTELLVEEYEEVPLALIAAT